MTPSAGLLGLGLALLSLSPATAAAAPNCSEQFLTSPPSCVTLEDAIAECAFEALYETHDNPRIFTIELTVTTGDSQFADSDGPVWVRLDGHKKTFLNTPANDFEHGDQQRFVLVGTGVEQLSDIVRLEIGNDSANFWEIAGVELRLNGVQVFETPAGFSHSVGNGKSRWWAPSDMDLEAQRISFTKLPNSLDVRAALETVVGDLFESIPGVAADWNMNHGDWDDNGNFVLNVDPADDTRASFAGHVVAKRGEADIYADLSGDIQVSCEDGTFALMPGNVGLDVTYVDIHGFWLELGSSFLDPEDFAQDIVDGLLGDVNAELATRSAQIEIGPLLDQLGLELNAVQRDAILAELCPDPRFSGNNLLFNWADSLAGASVRVEIGDTPQLLVCEPFDPPPYDPSEWDPDPDLTPNPFDADFDFPPNLVIDGIVDLGDETLEVTVRNAGLGASAATYLDVFFERQTPPAIGEYGDAFDQVPGLDAGATHVIIVDKLGSGWVDAIVDTDEYIDESDEDDNWFDALIW